MTTITDNGFFIDVTIDSIVTTIKKTQVITIVNPDNADEIIFSFWRVFPSVLTGQYTIDYNDVTDPASVSGADLKINVDALLI